MPPITVCIELDTDTGKVAVGLEPPESAEGGDQPAGQPPAKQPAEAQAQALMGGGEPGGEEQAEASYLKPVASIDEALQVARQLLTQGAAPQGDGQNAPDADAQMQQGFGGRQPVSMPNRSGTA